jgi:hypothetical protein
VSDVRVLVDGTVRAERLDGSAIDLDPGPHRLRLEPARGAVVEQDVLARIGEKNRAIDAVVGAPSAAPTTPADVTRPHRLPTTAYVFGGVAAVAFGSFAFFGITGYARLQDMRSSCRPFCAQGDIDALRQKLLVADISLGIGLVAAAATAWVVLSQRPERTP